MKAILIDLTNIKSFEEEITLFSSMTDEEVIDTYNVDCRDEAIDYIREYWDMVTDEPSFDLDELLQHTRECWEMMN